MGRHGKLCDFFPFDRSGILRPRCVLQASERTSGGRDRRIRETREGTGATKGNRPPDKGSRRPGYRTAEEHPEFSPIVRLEGVIGPLEILKVSPIEQFSSGL